MVRRTGKLQNLEKKEGKQVEKEEEKLVVNNEDDDDDEEVSNEAEASLTAENGEGEADENEGEEEDNVEENEEEEDNEEDKTSTNVTGILCIFLSLFSSSPILFM